jgi:3-hydroxy-9,10-secoandrosta-1,3,5(10)-triene-9,17-dione monooxygenase
MTARARAADGGYRLDGKWAYASNCLHAHWAVLSAPLPRGDAVAPSILLVPMRDLAIEESWHVVAMRGTGSHTVIAKDIFVPAHRALPTEILAQGRSPRTNRDEFVYRESFAPTAIIAVAAPVLGMAQAALDLTLERINKSPKAIAYSFYDDLRKAPSMQHELAEAATLIEIAVLHVRRWCDDIAEAARAGEELPFTKRAQMRVDLGYVMARCREAVGLLLNVQGASAFAESNPIQRVWRDLEMASRHGAVGRRNSAGNLRTRAGRQFRAAVADGLSRVLRKRRVRRCNAPKRAGVACVAILSSRCDTAGISDFPIRPSNLLGGI